LGECEGAGADLLARGVLRHKGQAFRAVGFDVGSDRATVTGGARVYKCNVSVDDCPLVGAGVEGAVVVERQGCRGHPAGMREGRVRHTTSATAQRICGPGAGEGTHGEQLAARVGAQCQFFGQPDRI
jgi:hypothetical protein